MKEGWNFGFFCICQNMKWNLQQNTIRLYQEFDMLIHFDGSRFVSFKKNNDFFDDFYQSPELKDVLKKITNQF